MQLTCIFKNCDLRSAVRGSPLFRFFLVSIGLVLTAMGLHQVTRTKEIASLDVPTHKATTDSLIVVPFQLQLSAVPMHIEMMATKPVTFESPSATEHGSMEIDPANPQVKLTVRWAEPTQAGVFHFAKLTLDPPNQPSVIHVFDSQTDIDDLWEPTISPAK